MPRRRINGNEHGKGFKPGQSGNPSGRPRGDREVVELARAHSVEAVQTLANVLKNAKARPAEQIAAANSLLDRAYGKPKQVADVRVRGHIRELSDDELIAIIRSGGAAGEEESASEHGSVH